VSCSVCQWRWTLGNDAPDLTPGQVLCLAAFHREMIDNPSTSWLKPGAWTLTLAKIDAAE
jgi:hypothetical protein